MDEMDPTDFWEYMAFNPNAYPLVRQVLWPVVPAEERIWIERLFEEFIEDTRRTPLPLTVRHNDMFPYHIIVNLPEQTLSGVIDFNWRVADPAGDLRHSSTTGNRSSTRSMPITGIRWTRGLTAGGSFTPGTMRYSRRSARTWPETASASRHPASHSLPTFAPTHCLPDSDYLALAAHRRSVSRRPRCTAHCLPQW